MDTYLMLVLVLQLLLLGSVYSLLSIICRLLLLLKKNFYSLVKQAVAEIMLLALLLFF
jgi:hypothetical protein